MNRISYNQSSSTVGQSLIMAGLIASQLVQAGVLEDEPVKAAKPILISPYYQDAVASTFDQLSNPLTGKYTHTADKLEQAASALYVKLLSSQEPLGAEFEKVLYDNLWDLYES